MPQRMTRKEGLLSLLLIAVLATRAHALGLGDIELYSAYGEPLQATIPVLSEENLENQLLQVNLASEAEYRARGIERVNYLSRLRVQLYRSDPDSPRIRISNPDALYDPYLELLIQLRSPYGAVQREYVLLPPIRRFGSAASQPLPIGGESARTNLVGSLPVATARQAEPVIPARFPALQERFALRAAGFVSFQSFQQNPRPIFPERELEVAQNSSALLQLSADPLSPESLERLSGSDSAEVLAIRDELVAARVRNATLESELAALREQIEPLQAMLEQQLLVESRPEDAAQEAAIQTPAARVEPASDDSFWTRWSASSWILVPLSILLLGALAALAIVRSGRRQHRRIVRDQSVPVPIWARNEEIELPAVAQGDPARESNPRSASKQAQPEKERLYRGVKPAPLTNLPDQDSGAKSSGLTSDDEAVIDLSGEGLKPGVQSAEVSDDELGEELSAWQGGKDRPADDQGAGASALDDELEIGSALWGDEADEDELEFFLDDSDDSESQITAGAESVEQQAQTVEPLEFSAGKGPQTSGQDGSGQAWNDDEQDEGDFADDIERELEQFYERYVASSATRTDLKQAKRQKAEMASELPDRMIDRGTAEFHFLTPELTQFEKIDSDLVNQLIEAAINEAAESGRDLALYYIDLDRFDLLQAELGETRAAELVSQLGAELLRVAGKGAVMARLRDHTLVLVMPQKSRELAFEVGVYLARIAADQTASNGEPCTVSIGICGINEYAPSSETLLAEAEEAAMEQRRKVGDGRGNGARISTPLTKKEVEEDPEGLIGLADYLLQRRKFELKYQPVITLKGEQLLAYEANLSLAASVDQSRLPDRFIQKVFETDKASTLDNWIFESAIATLETKWQLQPNTHLFLRVSTHSLKDHRAFLKSLNQMLQNARFDDSALILQLTEHDFALYPNECQAFIKEARKMGLSLCIYGLGGSEVPLEEYASLDVDYAKLDVSLSVTAQRNDIDLQRLEQMLEDIQEMKCKLILPAVERPEFIDTARRLNIDYLQGHYFFEPTRYMEYKFPVL